MHVIRCGEIWGGNLPQDTSVCTSGVTAALCSAVHEGARGGDIYYFSVCSWDKLTRIAIADMRGHGDAASELSGWLYEALAERMNSLDGAAILEQLNVLVKERGFSALTTAAIAAYYKDTGKIYFTYAGHPPMIARQCAGGWTVLEVPSSPGLANLPLGVAACVRYDQAEVEASPGDRLVLFTDGVTERVNGAGEFYGLERLQAVLRRHGEEEAGDLKRAILADLTDFAAGAQPDDDITLLVIEISG